MHINLREKRKVPFLLRLQRKKKKKKNKSELLVWVKVFIVISFWCSYIEE